MQDFYIKKHISHKKKKNPFGPVVNFFILLIAIPVLAISFISLFFYFLFIWIFSSFKKNATSQGTEEHYHFEMKLLSNEYVTIVLEEDELDMELSQLNDLWMANVYNKETCLYRARTVPVIEKLEAKIICFYLKQEEDGVILQLVDEMNTDTNPLNTKLVFLSYHNLEVTVLDTAGDYYLYNDEKNTKLIMGFNKKEKIRMEIVYRPPA